MEITLEAGELSRVIGCVKGITPTKTTIPILNNIFIKAEGRNLSVIATDLEMEAHASAIVETTVDGAVTIPAHVLFGLAKALPKAQLMTIKIEGGRAKVKSGRSKYDLRTLPAEDFPQMKWPDAETSKVITLPVADVMRALDLTRGTFDPNHPQPFYKGLWLIFADGALRFMSADGHRMSLIAGAAIEATATPPALLPAAAVREICGLLATAEGDVTLRVTGKDVAIYAGGVSLLARLIAAKLPQYERMIPKVDAPMVQVKASDLVDALDRILIVYASDIGSKQPIAVLNTTNGMLGIAGGSQGADYGSEFIPATINEPLRFGVSSKYLAELVRLWPSTAMLGISAVNGGPILITSSDTPDLTQVVMPMTPKNDTAKAFAEAAE